MTDLSKIPLPRGDDGATHQDSLIERAAERFDFNSYIAGPKPADLPPPRRAARPKSRPAPVAPAFTPVAEPQRATIEPTAEPVVAPVVESVAPAAEPVAPAPVFSTNRIAIDREHLRQNGLIEPEGSVTALLEEFRIVKRQLLLQAGELRRQKAGSKAQRVLISSPHSGEGKTYCAVNLALSIATERESDVLLVDADFAKPSILSSLGLPGGPGLMDALMDESTDVADFVIATDIPGLWVLPAGDTSTSDSEYISSSRTGKVLERLTQDAPNRMVIFDSPPALAASPAAELAKLVGQVLVIVRADSTGQGALEDAVSLLSACPNIQLLLNAAQFSPSGRRFGTYYGYKG
jgi:Mrp family chromosome partitioning ATPase